MPLGLRRELADERAQRLAPRDADEIAAAKEERQRRRTGARERARLRDDDRQVEPERRLEPRREVVLLAQLVLDLDPDDALRARRLEQAHDAEARDAEPAPDLLLGQAAVVVEARGVRELGSVGCRSYV